MKSLVPNIELEVFSNEQLSFFRDKLEDYSAKQYGTSNLRQKSGAHGDFDFCIFDSYETDFEWEIAVNEFCKRVVVIDDHFKKKHCCDIT